MALVSIWQWMGNNTWVRKLVDPASLRPRTPEDYWMFAVMDKPPAPSLAPDFKPPPPTVTSTPWSPPPPPAVRSTWEGPPAPRIRVKPKPRPRTDYERWARQIKTDEDKLEAGERARRAWVQHRHHKHKRELAELVKRWEAKQASAIGLTDWTASLLTDHDYIAAMFALYSSQRSRLV